MKSMVFFDDGAGGRSASIEENQRLTERCGPESLIDRKKEISALPAPRRGSTKGKTRERGFVYFFDDGELIKIGWSVNPDVRVKEIQRQHGKPLTILETFFGSSADEHRLKRHFKRLNVRGEWFRKTPKLLEFIASIGPVRWRFRDGMTVSSFLSGRGLKKLPTDDHFTPMLAWLEEKRPLIEHDKDLRTIAYHTQLDIKNAQKGGEAQRYWLRFAHEGIAKIHASTAQIGR